MQRPSKCQPHFPNPRVKTKLYSSSQEANTGFITDRTYWHDVLRCVTPVFPLDPYPTSPPSTRTLGVANTKFQNVTSSPIGASIGTLRPLGPFEWTGCRSEARLQGERGGGETRRPRLARSHSLSPDQQPAMDSASEGGVTAGGGAGHA